MKKLAILSSLSRGGAEHVSVYLAEYMVHHGIPCDFITLSKGEREYTLPQGVRRLNVGGRSIFKLRKTLRESGADLLLVMSVPMCIFAIPAVVGLPMKTVVSERNAPEHSTAKPPVKYFSRFLMRFADGYVFQTQQAKEFYDRMLGGRGAVIPNPLFTEHLPQAYFGQPRKKQIVSVGRLEPQKNQALLIDAFARIAGRFPDYGLTIYGEGSLHRDLERRVSKYGLTERVSLPGNIPDVLEKIQKASLFVFTSDYEGIPNALIEAMALGLPCISTDCPCGGPASLIRSGENGVLVEVGDEDGLVQAIEALLVESERAESMGIKAAEIRQLLDINIIGKQWKDYLDGL